MHSKILITGATGNVGAEITRLLIQQGLPPRLAVVDPSKAKALFGSAPEAVPFTFGEPACYALAFEGVEKLFLMRPPAIANVKKYIFPAIEAARKAGVKHVVFLSLIGAENTPFVPHYNIERCLLASGLTYTFLRPSFFMQNLSTTHRAEIRDEHQIYVPAGKGKTSFIDARDIAAVAALALTQPGHENQAYELTGSEALNYYEVARRLTSILGQNITYRNPSILQFIFRQLSKGTPLAFTLVMSAIYSTARLGRAGKITGEVRRLLKREPISFDQFIKDYRGSWLPVA